MQKILQYVKFLLKYSIIPIICIVSDRFIDLYAYAISDPYTNVWHSERLPALPLPPFKVLKFAILILATFSAILRLSRD